MAKRLLNEYYTFSPSTKTVTIPNRILRRESVVLVVHSSSNTILYNFSDPDLGIPSFIAPYSSTGTRFTLSYDTSSFSSSDALMILEETAYHDVTWTEEAHDATNKLRVAAPQALIDTDFEYGLQPIKWESLVLGNNIPSYYFKGGGNSLNVTALSGGNQTPRSLMTVTTGIAHGLVTSDLVNVSYSSNNDADGVFVITTVPSTTTFTYTSKGQINGGVFLSSTVIQGGSYFDTYTNSSILSRIITGVISSDNGIASPGSILTINTIGKHGLLPNMPILINSATTTTLNGSWQIYDIPSATSFRVLTPGFQTGTTTPTSGSVVVVTRPEANFVHRPSDGGVMITSTNLNDGITAIRQTRRYFRYQSGKGMQMSTGSKFTPHFDVNYTTSAGTSVTIAVQQKLNIASGVTLIVEGIEVNRGAANPYNGTFTCTFATSNGNVLQYNMTTSSTDTAPGGVNPQVSVENWTGASCRVGMFDNQNGFYYEYDGSTIFAVRRHSIKEGMGTIGVTTGSTTVTGTNTKFHKQMNPGDYIVIRGSSYLVTAIDSGTSMEISPAYRGPGTTTSLRFNITQNVRVPQSEWNLDRCDGTGPSGYNIDITKMQMCYIDYTWYGAGFIRFGFRMTNGDVIYCHKIANNNVNNQAYMRSGNLPARYEVYNIGPYARMISGSTANNGVNLASSDLTMVVDNAQYWPSSGAILVQQGNLTEVMGYGNKAYNSALSGWNLTGLDRRAFGGTSTNVTFTPTEYDGAAAGNSSVVSVTFLGCTCAPNIYHWGTSVIMDGGYDDDRSIQFAYARQTSITTIAAGTSVAVLSVRLAPSVDNSITGQFGVREIVNRMQLQMRSMGLVASTSVQVLGILNPSSFGGTTNPVLPDAWTYTSVVTQIGSGSLAQIIDHTGNTTTVTGGEQIFGFVTGAAGDTYDISQVRDLGNSIVSGNGSARTPGFPNGPDILTIVVRNNNAAAATITNLRLSWTEAQA
jgi:hypothetical protein